MDVVFLGWFVLAKVTLRCCTLPMFWRCLGTCYDRKDLLRLIWVGENYFETVASYLCLSGTWVFISTENGLENDFREIFVVFGAYSEIENLGSLDAMGVLSPD